MYDPRLPALPSIVKKTLERYGVKWPPPKGCFPPSPLVAYRRPQNIRDKIVRSKIPGTPRRAKRIIPGMTKCYNCVICPFVRESKTVQSTVSKCTVDINMPVNCQTRNILYCITCTKCSLHYVGESEWTLKERFNEHKGYVVNNKIAKATGEHFNQKGHKVSYKSVTVLEKIFSSDPAVQKEREKYFIAKMNARYKVLNKITWNCQLQHLKKNIFVYI